MAVSLSKIDLYNWNVYKDFVKWQQSCGKLIAVFLQEVVY